MIRTSRRTAGRSRAAVAALAAAGATLLAGCQAGQQAADRRADPDHRRRNSAPGRQPGAAGRRRSSIRRAAAGRRARTPGCELSWSTRARRRTRWSRCVPTRPAGSELSTTPGGGRRRPRPRPRSRPAGAASAVRVAVGVAVRVGRPGRRRRAGRPRRRRRPKPSPTEERRDRHPDPGRHGIVSCEDERPGDPADRADPAAAAGAGRPDHLRLPEAGRGDGAGRRSPSRWRRSSRRRRCRPRRARPAPRSSGRFCRRRPLRSPRWRRAGTVRRTGAASAGTPRPRWVGRCPECQAWGSVAEAGAAPVGLRPLAGAVTAGAVTAPARPIAEIDVEAARARPTGVGELDRVLGGGLVPGAVVLLAGEPGVGKSTLLLEVASRYAAAGGRPRWSSPARSRPPRCGCGPSGSARCTRSSTWPRRPTWPRVLGHVDAVVAGPAGGRLGADDRVAGGRGRAGGVTQVRAVAAALIAVAKERGMATVLVGHVTKDGAIAGPRVLEHLVDVVLQFEGERHSTLRLVRGGEEPVRPGRRGRLLRAAPTAASSGCADPSGLFLSRRGRAGAGHLRDGHRGGPAPAARRGAGAGRRVHAGHPAAGGQRPGLGPGRDGAGRAGAARPGPARRRRRLLRDRRRRPGDRAGGRPGARAGGGVGRPGHAAAAGPGGGRRGRPVRRGAPGRRGRPAAGRGGPARLHRARWCPPEPGPVPAGLRVDRGAGHAALARCAGAAAAAGDAGAARRASRSAEPRGRVTVDGLAARAIARTVAADRRLAQPRPGGEQVAVPDREDKLRTTLAMVAPGTGAAGRPGADPARQHRRADRARLRPAWSRRCAPAASRWTSSSPPPGCASWPRWTARSCCHRRLAGSCAPPSS